MDYKIDWLTLTLKPVNQNVTYSAIAFAGEVCPLENWCFDFLGLSEEKACFRKKQGSIQHYNTMYTYNGISIALSNPERFAEQGLMFRFSGDGIAYIEKLKGQTDSTWNWVTFLKEFFSLGAYGFNCRCTRIDLAFDDISFDDNSLIDLKIVEKALRNGEFTSMFRKNSNDNSIVPLEARQRVERNKAGETGNTIYLGNRKSKVFMRIYDKLAETKAHKEPYDEKIKHWVRMEFEFKDVRAMTVCDSLMLLTPEEFGQYMSKVTNNYIRFIIPKGDKAHYYRCASQKWWQKVVGTIEKARLAENKAYRNRFNASMKWLRRQVFPTIYAVLHCLNVDEFITDVRDCGKERIGRYGDNREMIIKDYLSDKQSVSYSGLDIHKATSEEYKEIIRELEVCAFGTRMRQQGYELCDALDMMDEYRAFHRVRIEGSYNMDICGFKNREQLEEEDFPFELLS